MNIYGSMLQAYTICPRQSWLMSRQLIGNQDDDFLKIGRLLTETSYKRERKEVRIGGSIVDVVKTEEGITTIIETKKSSKAIEASKLQLLFYLYQLEQKGITEINAEIRVPSERKIVEVFFTEEDRNYIETLLREVEQLLALEKPPVAKQIKYCKSCSYQEFCWA